MMLSVCGPDWSDVGKAGDKPNYQAIMDQFTGKGSGYPVAFPPILIHSPADGEPIKMNQTPAILLYLGQLYGLAPESPVELAHAMQVTLTCLDVLSNAEVAYHPVEYHGSYADQVKE